MDSNKTDMFIFPSWQEGSLKNKEREGLFLQITEIFWPILIILNLTVNSQELADSHRVAVMYSAFIFTPPIFFCFSRPPWQQPLMMLQQVFLCQNFLDLLVDQIHAPVGFSLTLKLFLFSSLLGKQQAIDLIFETSTWAATKISMYLTVLKPFFNLWEFRDYL